LCNYRRSVEFKNAFKYLQRRGLTLDDIKTYNIGYCESGQYKYSIIVPSYAIDGSLNYFVARKYYSKEYENPKLSKDIVVFELYLSMLFPLVLCEGVFDAIAIGRNAVPMLGKIVSKSILNFIIHNQINLIYLMLDADAKENIYLNVKKLLGTGTIIKVVLFDKDIDPGILSKCEIEKYLQNAIDGEENLLNFKLMKK